MNAGTVVELPLDENLLKVLSSESRREILRLLAERRMTGAELAQRLNLGKPAVSEHLQKLNQANLIERIDDPERRWVYYELTPQGRDILEPKRVRFYLVLGVAFIALLAGMALALAFVQLMDTPSSPDISPGIAEEHTPLAATVTSASAPSSTTSVPIASGPLRVTNQTVRYVPPGESVSGPSTLRILIAPTPVGQSVAPLPIRSNPVTNPTPTAVYTFSPQDVDLLNGTVTVHATGVETQGNVEVLAMDVPGLGLVQVDFDDLDEVLANGTAPAVNTTTPATVTTTSGTGTLPTPSTTSPTGPAGTDVSASQTAASSETPSTTTPGTTTTTPNSATSTTAAASQSAPATSDLSQASPSTETEPTQSDAQTPNAPQSNDAEPTRSSNAPVDNQPTSSAEAEPLGFTATGSPKPGTDRNPDAALPFVVLLAAALIAAFVRGQRGQS